MKLPILIDVAIILLIAFSVMKKNLNPLENIFVFMILEFLITSYNAILHLNLNLWEVPSEIELFIVYRIYEIIICPFLYLFFFNLIPSLSPRIIKCFFTLLFLGILYIVERKVIMSGIIIYKEWHLWESLVLQILVLIITNALLVSFRYQLQKEGTENK